MLIVAFGFVMPIGSHLVVFFALGKASQYLALGSLKIVVSRMGTRVHKYVKWLLILLHVVYLGFLVAGIILGTSKGNCASSEKSLTILLIKDGIYILFFILLIILHCKGYFLEKSDDP